MAIGGLLAIGRRFRGILTLRDTVAQGGCAVAGQPGRGGGSAALHRLDQSLQLRLLLLQVLAAEAQRLLLALDLPSLLRGLHEAIALTEGSQAALQRRHPSLQLGRLLV